MAYEATLNQFHEWIDGPDGIDLETVTAREIEAFMSRPRRGGIAPAAATQDRDRIAIAQFFRWAMARGLCASDPTFDVGVPKVRNRSPRAVNDAVWATLWASKMPDEDRVWLGLGCFAGLRRREITSITPESVDYRRGLLLNLLRKGGSEDAVEYEQMARIIADGLPTVLPDADHWLNLVAVLAEQRLGERILVTMDAPTTALQARYQSLEDGLPSPAVVNRRLAALLKSAGMSPTAFSPHALRHTCVTNLLRCGLPIEVVSDSVGHHDIDTTRRYVKSSGRLADWRDRINKV
jgi:integrase/recombinase XerD